ncbi:MAG: hypothetical protein FJ088_05115 [Deltaproteobacteria bacterium]|nr:hypothetical protein [Deltaproteobacteria bacterium]
MPLRWKIALALLPVLVYSSSGESSFRSVRRVIGNSAYTLEKSEFVIGLITPLEYGITDEVTLFTHPLLHLLLTPNGWLRWKIYDDNFAFALTTGYIETFLDPERLSFPGSVQTGGIFTIPFGNSVSLNFTGGYVLNVSPVSHNSNLSCGINLLVTDSDLISAQIHSIYSYSYGKFSTPLGILSYTHAWDIIRLTLGAAFGNFPVYFGNSEADLKELPVYPVVDLWWQF